MFFLVEGLEDDSPLGRLAGEGPVASTSALTCDASGNVSNPPGCGRRGVLAAELLVAFTEGGSLDVGGGGSMISGPNWNAEVGTWSEIEQVRAF
jgi:hypothetical protein